MASSSSLGLFSPESQEGECINWAELPSELLLSILSRLDTIDILENAQKVCTSWRRVCKDPALWRKINMRKLGKLGYNIETLCRHVVDLSQGGLVELDFGYMGPESLLSYIADRSSNLRSLKLEIVYPITTEGLTKALGKLPLLEKLEVAHFTRWEAYLKVAGQSCPNLKTLKLHCFGTGPPWYMYDDDALVIAETMPRLSHLQLFANKLTDAGLNAILDNCPDLEHLDLRQCSNVNLVGDMEKRCSERIKVFRRPRDTSHVTYSENEDLFTLDADYDQ
ncbi:hypothetical protein Bca101_019514 [Brassica carinata]